MRPWPRPTILEWIYLAGGLFLVFHYRWLVDDAFVYFRYVDNWVHLNLGLVYNQGEFVEGYSSPAFALVLAGLRSLGLGFPAAVLSIGLVCFAGFWFALVVLNRRMSPAGAPPLNLPLAYLALLYGVDSFFTSGLETPLAAALAPIYALFLLRPASPVLAALVGLSPLVRPELALCGALAAAFAWWRVGRFPWVLAGVAIAANGGWLAFRITTYADLFPNTFHLKNDSDWIQGAHYLRETLRTYHLVGLLALGAAAAVIARRRGAVAGDGHTAARLAMIGIAAAEMIWVARVGGSHVHYWYLAFAFPLLVCAVAGLSETALRALGAEGRAPWARAALVVMAAVVFSFHPPQTSAHPFGGGGEHAAVRFVDDPAYHRNHPDLDFDRATDIVGAERLAQVRESIAEQGYVSVGSNTWCRDHYANLDARVIHGFGLTDAILARVDVRARKPGHKTALMPLAQDLAVIQRHANPVGPGMYRLAVEAGTAPDWIALNLDAIETIARKTYNSHDFTENLALARTSPRIAIPPATR